ILTAPPTPSPQLCVHSGAYTPHPSIYTLSLHDALPISRSANGFFTAKRQTIGVTLGQPSTPSMHCCWRITQKISAWRTLFRSGRSEEHTSELQSRENLVCRLLLEKKNLLTDRNEAGGTY